ncbi:STAS domain-containing protein [Actinoplanes sp. NEAU-A12]|uniref:STAS domain-containing protein n=1 Tax=Actinoplanes sandaracinus TaxID=3045177 RepID=A0ABT6WZD0_9ACTN|nr:STAS domain-containing protein [Actinoplanes sandaracinus]MDI6105115.1 STAS domain-containing protein [Actinoplanes sandaracinus]
MAAHHAGSVLIITVAGDLAFETVAAGDPITVALTPAIRHVVIDVAELDFVDVAGLRALLRTRHTCTGHGVTFTLRGPGASLRCLTDLTDTTGLLLGADADLGTDQPSAALQPPGPATPSGREQQLDEREALADDRELLADERDHLLAERQDRVAAHQDWEDIREDLANQREHNLEHREQRPPNSRDHDC